MSHGFHCAIQVPAVHPLRIDTLVILPAGIDGTIYIGVHHPSVILPVQAAPYPPAGEGYAFCVTLPVCRDPVPAPEAGFGGVALFLQDDPDPVTRAYCLKDSAEPGERHLYKRLVVSPPYVDPLLLPPVIPDDEIGKAPLLHKAADIMGILVESITQESVTLPADPLHLFCDRRMICLRVMSLHLLGPQEGHPLIEPLVLSFNRSALDDNGLIPLVICDGCEVVKAGIQHHHTGRCPVGGNDIPFIRKEFFFLQAVIRDDLNLVCPFPHAAGRQCRGCGGYASSPASRLYILSYSMEKRACRALYSMRYCSVLR